MFDELLLMLAGAFFWGLLPTWMVWLPALALGGWLRKSPFLAVLAGVMVGVVCALIAPQHLSFISSRIYLFALLIALGAVSAGAVSAGFRFAASWLGALAAGQGIALAVSLLLAGVAWNIMAQAASAGWIRRMFFPDAILLLVMGFLGAQIGCFIYRLGTRSVPDTDDE